MQAGGLGVERFQVGDTIDWNDDQLSNRLKVEVGDGPFEVLKARGRRFGDWGADLKSQLVYPAKVVDGQLVVW